MGVTKFTLITDDGEEIVMEGDNLTTADVLRAIGADKEDFDNDPSITECPECHGTGGNPWDDGTTPCDYCDGEGYLYWLT